MINIPSFNSLNTLNPLCVLFGLFQNKARSRSSFIISLVLQIHRSLHSLATVQNLIIHRIPYQHLRYLGPREDSISTCSSPGSMNSRRISAKTNSFEHTIAMWLIVVWASHRAIVEARGVVESSPGSFLAYHNRMADLFLESSASSRVIEPRGCIFIWCLFMEMMCWRGILLRYVMWWTEAEIPFPFWWVRRKCLKGKNDFRDHRYTSCAKLIKAKSLHLLFPVVWHLLKKIAFQMCSID